MASFDSFACITEAQNLSPIKLGIALIAKVAWENRTLDTVLCPSFRHSGHLLIFCASACVACCVSAPKPLLLLGLKYEYQFCAVPIDYL